MASLFSARSFAERAANRAASKSAGADADTRPSAELDKTVPQRPVAVEEARRPPEAAARDTQGDAGARRSSATAPKPPRQPPQRATPASTRSGRGPHPGAEASGAISLSPVVSVDTLRLVPLQALAKGGRWRTEAMRSYRTPVLLWFTRGQGRITLSGQTRGYGAHNAVYVPPRCMHGFEVTAQVFGTAVFFNEAHGLPLPDHPVHLRVRDGAAQSEMTTILEQLGREIDGDRPLRDRAIAHHAGLLSVWLDRQVGELGGAHPDTASLRLVRRFTQAVEAQLYTGQGVSDYAEALGVTPTHLSRVCRETCGRSASDILSDRVTFEARRLLVETSLPVKQVAQILGYGSAAYFTRAFQNRTGQTPTQFRSAA